MERWKKLEKSNRGHEAENPEADPRAGLPVPD
jgi:hypothetical protein